MKPRNIHSREKLRARKKIAEYQLSLQQKKAREADV
jgi:hypothetical protein